MDSNEDFSGAKVALFLGDDLLLIRRDDRPDIPWPGRWDLPGGGRESGETPEACVLREAHEEIGLRLFAHELNWKQSYTRPHGLVWFFAAHRPVSDRALVRFGAEGQEWRLMSSKAFVENPMAVPHFRQQVAHYLEQGKR